MHDRTLLFDMRSIRFTTHVDLHLKACTAPTAARLLESCKRELQKGRRIDPVYHHVDLHRKARKAFDPEFVSFPKVTLRYWSNI